MSPRCGVGGTVPFVGLYAAAGSPGFTKRNVSDENSLVAPSNSRVMRMHFVGSASPGACAGTGHDSTQMPQYMHLPMSMSKRVMTRPWPCFSTSMAMTLIGQSRSHALHAVHSAMSTSRKPR